MNNLKLTVLFVFILIASNIKGQSEIEIKTTGKYIYSWAIDEDEAKAKEIAKLGLLDIIFVSIIKQSAIDVTDTIFVNVINYFVKKVGLKWQTIAFADKSDIKVKLEQRMKIQVIPIIIGEHSTSKDNKTVVIEMTKDIPKTEDAANTGNALLDELLKIADSQLLEKKLSSSKANLKLNYGNKTNYPDDSACIVFVIDSKTRKIIAIYDKGKKDRKNLLTNETESDYIVKNKGNHFIYVVFN